MSLDEKSPLIQQYTNTMILCHSLRSHSIIFRSEHDDNQSKKKDKKPKGIVVKGTNGSVAYCCHGDIGKVRV